MTTAAMEAKLYQFRKERKKQEIKNQIKSTASQLFTNLFPPKDRPESKHSPPQASLGDDLAPLLDSELPEKTSPTKQHAESRKEPLSWKLKLVYFALWIAVYYYFIYIEFGAIYFILSMLVGVWLNTRTGEKLEGEVSAYSVFNPNCEPIDGTLNAEQFEKEIRSGFF